MDFTEMLELIRNPPESGVPDDIFDQMGSYVLGREQRDRDALEGAQHRIAELESSSQAHTDEIARLKAQNFDLLMSTGAGSAGGGDSGGDDESDKALTTDDLFETGTTP